MEQVIYWVTVVAVLWFSMPALTARKKRALGVVLAVLLPLFSWVWLVWIGIGHRVQAEADRRIAGVAAERERLAHDVAFWRGRARTGTPAEQEAARMYLEALGYAVEPGPAEQNAPALEAASTRRLAEWHLWYQRVVQSGDGTEHLRLVDQAVHAELMRRQQPQGVISVPEGAPEPAADVMRRAAEAARVVPRVIQVPSGVFRRNGHRR